MNSQTYLLRNPGLAFSSIYQPHFFPPPLPLLPFPPLPPSPVLPVVCSVPALIPDTFDTKDINGGRVDRVSGRQGHEMGNGMLVDEDEARLGGEGNDNERDRCKLGMFNESLLPAMQASVIEIVPKSSVTIIALMRVKV